MEAIAFNSASAEERDEQIREAHRKLSRDTEAMSRRRIERQQREAEES